MPNGLVAVRDPHAVAPRGFLRLSVIIAIRVTDIRHRGKDDRIQAERVHPFLEVDASGSLEARYALVEIRDLVFGQHPFPGK